MWHQLPIDWQRRLTWGVLLYLVVSGWAAHGLHTCSDASHPSVQGHVHASVHGHSCPFHDKAHHHSHRQLAESEVDADGESSDPHGHLPTSHETCLACKWLAQPVVVSIPASLLSVASLQESIHAPCALFWGETTERLCSPRAPPCACFV